ncbi:hypothetical protein QOT17_016820 [Balamuthia mandrillaris]
MEGEQEDKFEACPPLEEGLEQGVPPIKNIIWDLGGVLIQWNPRLVVSTLFSERGEENIPYDLCETTALPCWKDLDRGTITREEAVAMLPSHYNKEDYRTFVDGVGPFFIPLKPGVDLLNQLRATGRYRHFVLSNFHRDYFEEIRARYNHTEVCFSLFDGLCVSAWHHHIKPEREIYMMLFREFGLNPRECLFIDDSEVNVRAGEEFGMRGVVCRDHDQLKEDLQRFKLL